MTEPLAPLPDRLVAPSPTSNDKAEAGSRAAGRAFFSFVRALAPAFAQLVQPPDPMQVLQERLLRIQLTRELHGAAVPYAHHPWPPIPDERTDFVILGPRGTGKTATASGLAQSLRDALDVPVLAVDWPADKARQLGFRTAGKDWSEQRDAVVILDEASLRTGVGRRNDAIFQALALARHRNLHTIWTSQTSTAVLLDVLRMEPILIWTGATPLAGKLERDDIIDLHATAATIGLSNGWPDRRDVRVLWFAGRWAVTAQPLPLGWTETTSKLWRH